MFEGVLALEKMILTSLLGEKAAQKFNKGFTVLKVWFPEMSWARRVASWINLSYSSWTSVVL